MILQLLNKNILNGDKGLTGDVFKKIEKEIIEFYYNDLKIETPYHPLVINKIKCLNIQKHIYTKITLDFEIYNVFEKDGIEQYHKIFFTDEVIIKIATKRLI